MEESARVRFLEGRKRYLEDFFKMHGYHPNKGRVPKAGFKTGNTLWLGKHHTDVTKQKLSQVFRGKPTGPRSAETRKRMSDSHLGLAPWNKGLTRETSPILARMGEASRKRWTPEKRRALGERNTRFWNEWWPKHPEARATITQVSRPTSIELLARQSVIRRGIPMTLSKRLEDVCYPDVILHTLKIAVFCHGCFWHACPQHNPIVPDWLRAKIKDGFVSRELEKRGWRVLVAWEHEFKTNKDVVGEKLDLMLGSGSRAIE